MEKYIYQFYRYDMKQIHQKLKTKKDMLKEYTEGDFFSIEGGSISFHQQFCQQSYFIGPALTNCYITCSDYY